MKNKRFEIWLFITMCMVLCCTACSTKSSLTTQTPYYSITIDGEQKFYTDKDATIQQIKKLTESYVMVSTQCDYQNLGLVEEEFEFYISSEQENMKSYDWINEIKDQITTYQLKHEVSEHTVTGIQLRAQHGKRLATVTCDYITSTKHATEEYLTEVGISIGKNYRRTMTLELELEEGEWKIADYDITAREEV